MNKKKDLASALQAQDEAGQGAGAFQPDRSDPSVVKSRSDSLPAGKSRHGMVNIAGWFPTNVKFQLEELRLERSRKAGRKITLQQMQAEAYNDLFKKYGRPELARICT